jgi:hypothetical protein
VQNTVISTVGVAFAKPVRITSAGQAKFATSATLTRARRRAFREITTMPRKITLTAKRVEKALRGAGGLKTVTAKSLGCHRATLYRFLERHPKLIEIAGEIDEETKDLAEGKVLDAIKSGCMQTVRWFLETKGKDRGYTRRVENTGKDGGPIATQAAPDLSKLTNEELDILITAAQRRERPE